MIEKTENSGTMLTLILRADFSAPGIQCLTSVQRFFTDGYFHKHRTARELKQILTLPELTDFRVSVTQMAERMMPGLPRTLDAMLKRRYGC
jgi:hypothetical protein